MNERHETLTVADRGNRAEIRIVAFFILSFFYKALLDAKKKTLLKVMISLLSTFEWFPVGFEHSGGSS